MSLNKLYTRKQAHLFYQVLGKEGPSKDTRHKILQVFHDVFDDAVEGKKSYEKRLELYHSLPFKELTTKGAVIPKVNE